MFKLLMIILTLPAVLFLLCILLIRLNLVPSSLMNLTSFGYFMIFGYIAGIGLPILAVISALIHYLLSGKK